MTATPWMTKGEVSDGWPAVASREAALGSGDGFCVEPRSAVVWPMCVSADKARGRARWKMAGHIWVS